MRHSCCLSLPLFVIALLSFSANGQPLPGPPKIIRFAMEGNRTCVAFSPDGKTLATGSQDNFVRLWDVTTHKQRLAISAHKAAAGVSRITYFPDGKTLVSASWAGDGTMKIWDVATGEAVQHVGENRGGIAYAAVSPDGNFIAWNAGGGKISLFDVKAAREARKLLPPHAIDSVAFSPDSKLLATANGDGTVRLWDVATGKTIRVVQAAASTSTGSQAVAFSRDGKTIVTAGHKKVRFWNVASGEELASIDFKDEVPFCIAVSPDGRYLAAGTNETLRVWDWATRKELHRWNESIASVAFSNYGRWLAFGSRAFNGGAGLIDLGFEIK